MHEYTSTVRIWELTCPGLPEEIARVRRWTRDVLSETPYADDAALIITELSTNALRHSASGNGLGAFHVEVIQASRTLAVSVTDCGGGATRPHVEAPDGDETTGRGLGLVATLADYVEVSGDGKRGHTVMAEFHDEARHSQSKMPAAALQGHTP